MVSFTLNDKRVSVDADPNTPLLWVTCGRRPGKNFLTFLQHWSGAVTCPAC
jgi:aerobic-type carbon monoxide dehydrogenase small subunit (CoxS/CutS family)